MSVAGRGLEEVEAEPLVVLALGVAAGLVRVAGQHPAAEGLDPGRERLDVVDPEVHRHGLPVGGRRPVEPGYLTMHTADAERAERFFGELFDWQMVVGSQGEGNRHIANTTFPMGFTTPAADGQAVSVYFRVDDIEPFAAKVEALGGRVLSRNTYESGGNAECEDDQGFRFDLFQPAPGY